MHTDESKEYGKWYLYSNYGRYSRELNELLHPDNGHANKRYSDMRFQVPENDGTIVKSDYGYIKGIRDGSSLLDYCQKISEFVAESTSFSLS